MSYNTHFGSLSFFVSPDTVSHKARISGTIVSSLPGVRIINLLNRDTMAIVGTTVANPDGSWAINTEFTNDGKLIVICLDESENYNASVYDRVSLCSIEFDYNYLSEAFFYSKPSFQQVVPITFNGNPWNLEHINEDVKGQITKFYLDTPGVSGRMMDTNNNVIDLSTTRVGIGTLFQDNYISGDYGLPESRVSRINAVEGNGTTNNSVITRQTCIGRSYTTQILGDSSCILFAPLTVGREGYGYNVDDLLIYKLNMKAGRDFYSNSYGETGQTRGAMVFTQTRLPTGPLTLSFNYYPYSTTAGYVVCQKYGFEIYYQSGYFYINWTNNAGATYNVSTNHAYSFSNTWHHLIFSMDSTNMKIYSDGVLRVTTAGNYNHNPKATPYQSDSRFSILGSSGFGHEVGGISTTDARMNMVRVFNRKITDAEAVILNAESTSANPGAHTLNYLTNIMSTPGSIGVPTEAVGTNTATLKSLNPKNPLDSLQSININIHKNLNVVSTDYFGRHERQLLLSSFSSANSTYTHYGFNGDNAYNSTGGWVPNVSKLYREPDMNYFWFQINLPKSSVMRGLKFRPYSYSSYFDIPTKLEVYTSETGLFRGEELYRGSTQIWLNTLGENDILPAFKFNFFAKGKHYRFYMKIRSTLITAENGGIFGFRAVTFELEDKTNFEAVKTRSIVLDMSDTYTTTGYMGIVKFVPTIGGKPLNIFGWKFYQSSYNPTYSNFAERAFSTMDSSRGDIRHCWRSASGSITNQRIIAVAPKEIEFDDFNVVNYHQNMTTATYDGVEGVKITISPDIINSTVYNDTITNPTIMFSGKFQNMYPESSSEADYITNYDTGIDAKVNGFYGVGCKYHSVRSMAIDFSTNLGSESCMGVRKIEFWLRGRRTNFVLATATITASTGNVTTNLRNTFYSVSNHFGTYASLPSWKSGAGEVNNQRISLLFASNLYFDNIRIWNHMDSGVTGYDTNMGAKDVRVLGSLTATQPPTTYGSGWDGSYELIPKTELVKRNINVNRDNRFFSMDLGTAKTDYWSARSVVFDLHSTHNIYDNYIRIVQFLFMRNENPLPFKSWDVYSTHSDITNDAALAFNGNVTVTNSFSCGSGFGWTSSEGAPARIIVVFPETKNFDAIDLMNGFVYNAVNEYKRHSGVNEMTITITQNVLNASNITYMSTVNNGEVIFDGGVEAQPYTGVATTGAYHQQRIVSKISKYYSRAIEVLIQSNHTNGSTNITDSSYREFPLEIVGNVCHSTEQFIIGQSSIKTSSGFLNVNNFRGRVISWGHGGGAFMMGAWIYPTSTTGDKGIISRWGNSAGSYSYMLSVNNGYLEFKYSSDGTAITTFTGAILISTNQWTWVEIRRIGESIYMFVGGSLDTQFNYGVLTTIAGITTSQVNIGTYNSDLVNCFQGYLQEVVIKVGTVWDTVPSPGPTSFTNISPPEPGFGEVYVSLSFDELKRTYKVYSETNGWRSIVSCDPTIHGFVGDYDWYFRDDSNTWSKNNVYNRENALSLAVEYTENKMTSAYLNTLTNTQFYEVNGYTVYEPDIAISFSKDSDKVSLGVDGITINNKKYWVGSVPLKHAPTIAMSSSIDLLVTEGEYDKKWMDTYRDSLSIYNWVDGSGWVACTRGGAIPSVVSGNPTQGVVLFFKVEMDMTVCKVPFADCKPRLIVEIY